MPLPSIELPGSSPDWRYAPHQYELGTPYAAFPVSVGAPRLRRTTTGATRVATVELMATDAQAVDLHVWFEETLEAGSLPFAAQLLAPDGTREWWHARFLSPPQWTATPVGSGASVWKMNAQLRLEGDASVTGP